MKIEINMVYSDRFASPKPNTFVTPLPERMVLILYHHAFAYTSRTFLSDIRQRTLFRSAVR